MPHRSNLASPQFQAMAVFSGSELEEFADIVVQFDLVQVEGKTGVLLGMTSISFAQLTRAVDGVFDLILTHPGTRDVRGTLRIVSTIPTRHVQKNELTRRPEQSKRPPSAPTSAPTLGKKDVFATAQQQYAEMALALVSPPQSISQQYHFEFSFKKAEGGTDTRKLDVLEEMFESHFTYSVPVQYLRLLIDEHQRRVHDLEGIGRLPFEAWETARLTQLEQRAALLNFCREQLTLLETFHGPRFKSSRLKREPQLQFVPTNCHIQRMSVVDDRKLQRRYETVTFGAPSAQAIGFKRGGLKRLLQQRDDAAVVAGSGAPSATATTAPALSGGLAGVANGLLPPPLPVGDSTPTAFLATAKQLLNNVDMIERDIDSLRAKLTHAGYTPATLEQRARLLQAALAPLTERVFHLISMLEAPGVEYCHQAARLLDERAATQTHQRNASNPDALVETGGHNNPRSTTAGALDSGADARSRSVSVLNSGASVAVSTAHATSASPDSTSAAHPRTVSVSSASQRASDHILAALDQSAAASNAHPAGKQSPGPGVDWVSVEHHFTRETVPAMPAIFSSVLDDGTETKLQEQLRAVNHACKDLMMGDSSVDTSLLDRTSDELCELMSNVSKGVRACLLVVMSQIESRMLNFMELVQRRDVVFSQALASAVTGFVSILSTHGANPVFLEQLEQLGLLMQFESLLSTSGNEMGMLEDMVVGVQDLAHISFVLHSPTSPAALLHQQGIGAVGQPQPASVALPVPTAVEDEAWTVWLSGERREVTVHVRVSESVFSRLPQTLQEGRPVRLEPILFSQGVNEAQTLANTVGDASLQHGINDDNFRSLENYLQRYIAFRVGQHARSTSASATADVSTLATLDHDVNEELKLIDSIRVQLAGAMQLSKGKNIEILVLSERLVRRLNGVRLTSCKSAKDRTSMSVTLEQYTLLHDDYGLIPSSQQQVLDVMRGRGTRIKNAEKNIGEQRYAFNRIQLLTLPKLYRPPDNTAGAAMS
ncbi:hypothetical protein CAOG_010131 [Capsaspora owczarzaki ATCC 30864]|uniref:Uncharacterized protein n=1 Tax=Capsaspora owczarzaki (strain ATCC 30864) TaxID=595528 RepID=A0A0D2UR18_CAPO3|nr:hypothetical protein CAOG_010131 [Capsaspora owczarzaki ATCC 30864]